MKKINEQTNNECDIEIFNNVGADAHICLERNQSRNNIKFDKHNPNVVGADASVRLKQNKNNIITFEKHKPNIVGVGVPDDPKEKHKLVNKLTSNIPTSNLQFPTSNTAITLVALVITIIVLLILAGITLNMVIGENGIFAKASSAKNKTEVAQYEEELRMSVLEMQTDSATSGLEFNIDTIRKNLKQKIQELQNTDDIEITSAEESETIEGIYKGYEFTIDEKYVAHIGEKSTGIRILTNIEPTGWTKGPVKVNITVKSNNGLAKIKPGNEEEIDVGGKTEYVITKENIMQNTTFKYEVTDNQGTTTNKTIEIKNIDTNAPTKCEIENTENTEEGLKITVNAEDEESGIEKLEYHVIDGDNKEEIYTTNLIKLEKGTYNIYAIAYDKAGNTKQSSTQNIKIYKTYTGITAQMVANEPSKYYGLKVTDYTSQNGQNDWKIFYSDGEHIFLITGDYIDTTKANRINSATGMVTSKYSVYWNSNSVPSFQAVDKEVLTRFKTMGYELQSKNNNSRCVSTLLNANNWSKYKDSGDKAESAIGSPTIEMWMASWNNLYENIDGKLYCNNTNSFGYYVGTSSIPSTCKIDENVMSQKKGYRKALYYPHTEGYNGTYGYWLSSSTASSSVGVMYVHGIGKMYQVNSLYSAYNNPCIYGVRPVVSLNTGVTVNATDEE